MRDSKRITKIIVRLHTLWRKYPDLRFSQLLHLVYKVQDNFYTEDDVLLKRIEELIDERR